MTSPDITPYIDLTLEERSAQDLIDTALSDLRDRVPEYNPRETGLEVILLEGFAEMVEQSIFAINRLPGAIFEVLMRAFGIERYLGDPPKVDVTFSVANANGYTIPTGTRVVLTTDVGSLVFATVTETLIPAGASTGTALVIADENTSEYNGVPAGTDLAMLDAVPYVDYVRTETVVADGADAESDDEYLARGSSRFSRLSETLVLPDHFVQASLENPLVRRAYALDNYDPGVTASAPGDAPGHITVAVYGDNGPLSAEAREAMRLSFEDRTAANLAVHVIDPTITDVDVTATVRTDGAIGVAEVIAECEASIRDYISVDTWPWSGTVWRNELIALLSNALGVDRVVSITTPAGDQALSGYAPLARAGAVTITVVE